jgi:hypothetical protein
VRGISWSPGRTWRGPPRTDSYLRAADRDLPLMRAVNIKRGEDLTAVGRARLLDKLATQAMFRHRHRAERLRARTSRPPSPS